MSIYEAHSQVPNMHRYGYPVYTYCHLTGLQKKSYCVSAVGSPLSQAALHLHCLMNCLRILEGRGGEERRGEGRRGGEGEGREGRGGEGRGGRGGEGRGGEGRGGEGRPYE